MDKEIQGFITAFPNLQEKNSKCQGQSAKEGRQGKREGMLEKKPLIYLEEGEERISRSQVKERATEGRERQKPGKTLRELEQPCLCFRGNSLLLIF